MGRGGLVQEVLRCKVEVGLAWLRCVASLGRPCAGAPWRLNEPSVISKARTLDVLSLDFFPSGATKTARNCPQASPGYFQHLC